MRVSINVQKFNRPKISEGFASAGVLVALRIDKDALLPKIRLFERSEFSNFG